MFKYDIISESQRPLNCKVGFCFAGKNYEIPLFLLKAEKFCPYCFGELKYKFFTSGAGEELPELEFCENCGYSKKYSEEDKL